MSYAVAVLAFGLYFILRRRGGGGGGRVSKMLAKAWWVSPLMLLVASAAITNTIIGVWSAKLGGGMFGWVGGLVHASGATTAGVVFLLLLVGTCLDLVDKRPDGIAKTGLIVLPLLALIMVGPLAGTGRGLLDSINKASAHSVSSLIGG